MFKKNNQEGYIQVMEGIERKTLVYGENTLLAEFALKKGSILPRHHHSQEQTGYLVKGSLKLSVGNEMFEVKPGDSWCIPGDSEHWAEVLEDSVAVEVFSPVRGDYLPKDDG